MFVWSWWLHLRSSSVTKEKHLDTSINPGPLINDNKLKTVTRVQVHGQAHAHTHMLKFKVPNHKNAKNAKKAIKLKPQKEGGEI